MFPGVCATLSNMVLEMRLLRKLRLPMGDDEGVVVVVVFNGKCGYASQMKNVENEQGVSFHFNPFPSRSHISKQCSCSPSS